MKLIKSLKQVFKLPALLPSAPVQQHEVILTDEEKLELWHHLATWAQEEKLKAINAAIWRRSFAKSEERPWLTAEQLRERALIMGQRLEPRFAVDQWLEPVLEQLCYYFAQDPRFEELSEGFSLSKGLLIYGPIGCGKTLLLEIMARLDPRFSYRVEDCQEIARQYHVSGVESLYAYMRPVTTCFDDLGFKDSKAQNYGRKSNPMEEIFGARYRLRPRPLTHATTNCDGETLEAMFDARVWDRMGEMFNLIEFDEQAPSRRR